MPLVRHGNGVPARANRKAARKLSVPMMWRRNWMYPSPMPISSSGSWTRSWKQRDLLRLRGVSTASIFMKVILSRLVDTFFSRISLTMPPAPKSHNTACVLPREEPLHWQSRSSGYSSSWGSISKWVPLIPLQSSALYHNGHKGALSSFWPTYSRSMHYHGSALPHGSCFGGYGISG